MEETLRDMWPAWEETWVQDHIRADSRACQGRVAHQQSWQQNHEQSLMMWLPECLECQYEYHHPCFPIHEKQSAISSKVSNRGDDNGMKAKRASGLVCVCVYAS